MFPCFIPFVRFFGGLDLSMPCPMCLLRYSCIAPLILPACAAYFAMASVVYRFLQQQFSAMDSWFYYTNLTYTYMDWLQSCNLQCATIRITTTAIFFKRNVSECDSIRVLRAQYIESESWSHKALCFKKNCNFFSRRDPFFNPRMVISLCAWAGT